MEKSIKPEELKQKIIDMCLDEGILGKKLPEDPKLDFALELNFPPNSPRPVKLILLKPKDKKAILIQIATQIAKVHVEALNKNDKNGLLRFFQNFKKFMLVQNLLYNIDVQNARYFISDILYLDGLTENEFYRTIRRVFNAALYTNMMLEEMCGGDFKKRAMTDIDRFQSLDFSGGMYS